MPRASKARPRRIQIDLGPDWSYKLIGRIGVDLGWETQHAHIRPGLVVQVDWRDWGRFGVGVVDLGRSWFAFSCKLNTFVK